MCAGVAVTPHFFFIRENDRLGFVLNFGVDKGFESGVGTNAVILTISADKSAVKADVTGFAGRNDLQLSRKQVTLRDAVLLVEKLQNSKFKALFDILIGMRISADEHVELLPFNHLRGLLRHLVLAQMRQQIRDDKNRILLIFANAEFQFFTILQHDDAMECQRNRYPLIFLDPAVVMRFE